MPLRRGRSNKVVGGNIRTLVDDCKQSGKIGTSRPKTKAQAVRQAVAISLSKAGRSRSIPKTRAPKRKQ